MIVRCAVLLIVATCGALRSQGDLLAGLASRDAADRELARRTLHRLPLAQLPVDGLLRLLVHVDEHVVAAAASVLLHHAAGAAELRLLARHDSALVRALVLGVLDDTALAAALDDREPSVRQRAVIVLEDRGRLDDAGLAHALEDPDDTVAAIALAVVLHERVPLAPALLDGLRSAGRKRVLAGLVAQPRASAVPWLERIIATGDDAFEPDEQLLARAALPGDRLDAGMVRDLLRRALALEDVGAVHTACARLAPNVADGLVGWAGAALAEDVPIATLLPCLSNLSPRGEEHLLGVARTQPQDVCETVLQWLASRGSQRLGEQVAAALEGEIALEPYLLRRAGDHLDTPARVARVEGLLSSALDEQVQQLAFFALLDAHHYSPSLLAFALAEAGGGVSRVRRLLQLPLARLPADAWIALLQSERQEVRVLACNALTTGAYPEAVERVLVELMTHDPAVAPAAVRALVAFGSEATVRMLWPRLSAATRVQSVQALCDRQLPWIAVLLREERGRLEQAQVDLADEYGAVLLALAELGDGGAFERFVEDLGQRSLAILRRARETMVAGLLPAHAGALQRWLRAPTPEAAQLEILGWLAQRPDLDLRQTLVQLERDGSEELRDEARRALLVGAGAAPFHARLRQRITVGFDAGDRDLAHEVIGALRPPLSAEAIDLLARVVLLEPLADLRVAAARASETGLARSAEFPLHLPVVDLLRRGEAVGAGVFAQVADEARAHAHSALLDGRCLGHFVLALAPFPDLRAGLGPTLAQLLLEAAGADEAWRGPAELLLAEAAERDGRFEAAAELYQRAVRGLLRQPLPPLARRALLGDAAELGARAAALAARPFACRVRAALARGDRDAARVALTLAADLAVGDHDTGDEVDQLRKKIE